MDLYICEVLTHFDYADPSELLESEIECNKWIINNTRNVTHIDKIKVHRCMFKSTDDNTYTIRWEHILTYDIKESNVFLPIINIIRHVPV